MPQQQRLLLTDQPLWNRQQVLAENLILMDLVRTISDTEEAIEFCARRRLLANASTCNRCNRAHTIVTNSAFKTDGICWRCPGCSSVKSIRAGSFLEGSHLPLEKILIFMYGWSRNWAAKDCNLESGGMSMATQVDWANFLRDVCQDDLLRDPVVVVGDHGVDANGQRCPKEIGRDPLEIDEPLVSKRKYDDKERGPEYMWRQRYRGQNYLSVMFACIHVMYPV